ncbi:peptidylprolyl isomerase [Salipaludibacillus sp. HK11]|uniref:peptidylprolyl isomerase n=1 Tax=Salipaludibacillus sp. HK11 TaxID=3394320 RepID=UPI0039FDCB9E
MKKTNKFLTSIGLVAILALSACGNDNTNSDANSSNDASGVENEAIIHTNMGAIHLELFPEVAPLAVENFVTLGKEGYYEDVIFHRVIENFMIQGGDPTGTGMGGESAFGEPFEDEFDESVSHQKGALSMANSGANTNGSQFFIVHAEEGTPHLDGGHTVFGQVTEGMDVVDEIATTEVEPGDRPVEDVVIESVEILN